MAHVRRHRPWQIAEALATPAGVFLDRRRVLAGLGVGAAAALLPGLAACSKPEDPALLARKVRPALGPRYADLFPAPRSAAYTLGDERELTAESRAASYNNFYEFTTTQDEVWKLAAGFAVEPWKIEVAGLTAAPRTLDLDDLFRRFPLEERLYRFRCVERWAMQVPWTGFPLRRLIDFLQPLGSARYVRFASFQDPGRLPGQKQTPWYPWPYFEGLRLDEARHDLAFVALGSYGHALPMQHGAPWRLALPWKYGYKGPKSIVRIDFTAEQPATFWNDLQPAEYGFYSNVDPSKPHPRWSQAEEIDIGTGRRRPTLPFNGYAGQVAGRYTGREV